MTTASFAQRLNGRFDGMFRLTDAENLSNRIAQADGWYLVSPDEALPSEPVSGTNAANHYHTLVQEILRVERGVWTTMVYVQSAEHPDIIKVFHPKRAGCGCGPSMNVRPWWVISRIPPEEVPGWTVHACQPASPSWWPKNFLS